MPKRIRDLDQEYQILMLGALGLIMNGLMQLGALGSEGDVEMVEELGGMCRELGQEILESK